MQREFIISWNRCEWITNQAFPKYVWLQNGAKVFRKSHFNFLCICSLSFEDTNLMNSLVPDFTLQRVQVLIIDFQHIEQLQKWQFQCCYFKIFLAQLWIECMNVYQGFRQVWSQGGVNAAVSGVVEDLKFKISECSDPNWCFPDSAQLAVSVQLRQLTGQSQENTNFGCSLLKFKT